MKSSEFVSHNIPIYTLRPLFFALCSKCFLAGAKTESHRDDDDDDGGGEAQSETTVEHNSTQQGTQNRRDKNSLSITSNTMFYSSLFFFFLLLLIVVSLDAVVLWKAHNLSTEISLSHSLVWSDGLVFNTFNIHEKKNLFNFSEYKD